MAHIVLFHSALGLRPAVIDFAEALRQAGHHVETPDYYDGHVFSSEKSGIAYRDEVGVRELMNRAKESLINVPEDAVLAGFSLGSFLAQAFATKRPTARGAILLHNVEAPKGKWNSVPVQVHRYAQDPWINPADVSALRDAVETSGATFADCVVPGQGHLFTDLETPDGNAAARTSALEAINHFLR